MKQLFFEKVAKGPAWTPNGPFLFFSASERPSVFRHPWHRKYLSYVDIMMVIMNLSYVDIMMVIASCAGECAHQQTGKYLGHYAILRKIHFS